MELIMLPLLGVLALYVGIWSVSALVRLINRENSASMSIAYIGPRYRNSMPIEEAAAIIQNVESLLTHANEVLNSKSATVQVGISPPFNTEKNDGMEFFIHLRQRRVKLHYITANADEILNTLFGANGVISLVKRNKGWHWETEKGEHLNVETRRD